MGNRREPRLKKCVPVRIFGSDVDGHIFSEKIYTVNVSKQGVEVSGLQSKVEENEIVGLSYAPHKSHFRVKWVGPPGTPRAGHLGLLSLTPDKPFWDFLLPASSLDHFHGHEVERRKYPRLKATISVQIYPENGAAIWGTSSDLGVGGCYIEMPIPLKSGTKLRIKLWIGQSQLMAGGKVTNTTPGFGFGVQFTEIGEHDLQLMKAFLKTITEF